MFEPFPTFVIFERMPHAHSAQVSAVNSTSTWRRLYRFWDCQHCSRQSLCNLCRLEGVLCCFVAAVFMQSFDIWFIKLLHYVIVGINQTETTVLHRVARGDVLWGYLFGRVSYMHDWFALMNHLIDKSIIDRLSADDSWSKWNRPKNQAMRLN